MAQRKLGRGLGALVEIPPASEDGTARVHETVLGGREESVLALSGRSVEDFFRARAAETIVETPNVTLNLKQHAQPQDTRLQTPAPAPQNLAPTSPTEPPMCSPDDTPDVPDESPDDARGDQYMLFGAAAEPSPTSAPGVAQCVAEAVVAETPTDTLDVSVADRVAETAEAVVPEPVAPASVAPAPDSVQLAVPVAPPPGPEPEREPQPDPVFEDVLFDDVVFDMPSADGSADPAPAPEPEPEPRQIAAPAAPPAPVPEPATEPDAAPPSPVFDDDVFFLDETVGGIVLPDVELE